MKTLEKILLGAAAVIGLGLFAQQCSKSLIELYHNLPPRSYSVNYEPTTSQQEYLYQNQSYKE